MDTPSTQHEGLARVTLSMPASLADELRLVAEENDRSLSAEARLALKAWLAQYAERAA